MKKTVLRILVLVMAAAVALTVVHFAAMGNNTPTDTAFTFAVEDGGAILTGSNDTLSGAVMLPDTLGGYPVVGIGENAFKDCTDVTAFFLPDTVTSIGAYAFENCTSLAQAVLPAGLDSIGDGAFWKCAGLVSISLPASVRSIGSCAFYQCTGLESVVVLGKSTSIKGAFNVALDIGQTLAIRNPARYTLDPIATTVYCFAKSAAYYDLLQDDFAAYELLDDCVLTSYTVRYVDAEGGDVAIPFTQTVQPAGIRVAAVARVADDPELSYPDPGTQTIELSGSASQNVMTFVYSGKSYTITFDANGGEEKDALVYAASDAYTLGDTTRYGYTFKGWKVVEFTSDPHYSWGDAGTVYLAADAVTGMYGDVKLEAVWEALSFTVTFDAQGGTADAQSTLVEFGGTYGELAGAVREGYTFDGWYNADGVRIEPTTTVTAVAAHTLYAQWTIHKYDVTVTTDGNGTAEADKTADVEYGTPVTLTATPNPGYAFSAWESEDALIADNAFNMPDKAVEVRAVFAPIEYTVTYDPDGGEAKDALTYVITDDTLLGGTTKPGYTFSYWTVAVSDGNWGAVGKAQSASSTVNGKYGNVTLKAIWRANTLTVTYDGRGGTPAVESKIVTVGGTYGTLTSATREGYTFAGWYTQAEGGSRIESSTTVTQLVDHTIFAHWTINSYNITLTTDGNGFISADETTNVPYGTVVTVTAAPKPGYVFSEWITDDVTFDGDTITMPDKPVTIKATFVPAAYTVTFDTDGGNAKDALPYKTTDETALGNATREGYTFTAWRVSTPAAAGDYNWGDTQTTYTAAQTVKGKYGDVTLKALWTGNNITVTYNPQGGASSSETKTVTVGGTYGTLAGAAREGYTFDGWYTDASAGTKITADTPVTATADHTVFAHWTVNTYNLTVTTDGNGTAAADQTAPVAYGTQVTLNAEANAGYAFLAWESSVTVTDNTFTMPAKAVTVKATFAPIAYTIAFDANYETDQTMEPLDAVYDADAVLPECTFERAGFAFLGWAATDDAETPDYEDGTAVRNLTAKAGETVTLYAVWQDIQVELIAKEGATTVIDSERGFIYGLKTEMQMDELLNDYLDVVGNGRLELTSAMIGTGTVVQLYNENNGELVAEYTLVIFGDVNGDGHVNSSDVTELRNMNAGLIEYAADSAQYFAADITHDGNVNSSDVTEARIANAGISEISQVIE